MVSVTISTILCSYICWIHLCGSLVKNLSICFLSLICTWETVALRGQCPALGPVEAESYLGLRCSQALSWGYVWFHWSNPTKRGSRKCVSSSVGLLFSPASGYQRSMELLVSSLWTYSRFFWPCMHSKWTKGEQCESNDFWCWSLPVGPVIFLNRLSSVVFKIYKDEVAHPKLWKVPPHSLRGPGLTRNADTVAY